MNRGAWIHTFSKKRFYPLDPKPEDVCVADIAHHLSLICRFNGACNEFYSVAQHSCLVARITERWTAQLACDGFGTNYVRAKLFGILHDAPEAYIGDITRPFKECMKKNGFDPKPIDESILKAIFEYLEISPEKLGDELLWRQVKKADDTCLAMEARDLHNDWENIWSTWNLPCNPLPDKIRSWDWKTSRSNFLKTIIMCCPSVGEIIVRKEPEIYKLMILDQCERVAFEEMFKVKIEVTNGLP